MEKFPRNKREKKDEKHCKIKGQRNRNEGIKIGWNNETNVRGVAGGEMAVSKVAKVATMTVHRPNEPARIPAKSASLNTCTASSSVPLNRTSIVVTRALMSSIPLGFCDATTYLRIPRDTFELHARTCINVHTYTHTHQCECNVCIIHATYESIQTITIGRIFTYHMRCVQHFENGYMKRLLWLLLTKFESNLKMLNMEIHTWTIIV